MASLGILAGRGYVSIVPDLTRFSSELAAGVNSSLVAVSASGKIAAGLSSVGTALTKYVSVPLGIVGIAATKMALDFDASFVRIDTLAGNLGVSMDQAKASVLQLAGATAQSPQALADALYFVASAGLEASQVMPTLEASAKGAAIGMGDVQTIAQTLTSVLNAYAGTGLDAANAMNIMTEAVKVGKAEATDFATGLGPVIGVAAQAGVSFNDLAAALAQATNLGVPFNRAVTGLRFLIASLEAPTQKAATALGTIGVSVDDVAAALKQPGGLEHELQLLATKFDLTTAAGRAGFAAIVGGARGGIVAMDLIGKHTAQTNAIVDDLGQSALDSSKIFETAFGKVSGSALFKAKKALSDFSVSMVLLGQRLLPVAIKVVQFLGDMAKKFQELSPHAQDLAVKFGAIAFAAGPVLKILGGLIGIGIKLAPVFTSIGSAAVSAGSGLTTAFGAMGLLGTAATGLAAGIGLLILKHKIESDLARDNAIAVQGMADALVQGKISSGDLAAQIAASAPGFAQQALSFKVISEVGAAAAAQIAAYGKLVQQAIGPLDANTSAMVSAAVASGDYARAMGILKAAADGYFASLGPMASAEQQSADAAIQSATEHQGLALALGGVSTAAVSLGDSAITTGGKVKTIGDSAKTSAADLAALAKAFKPVADSLATNADFVTGALTTMAGEAKTSGKEILTAFDKALSAEINYKKNFEALVKRGLPADFAQQLADMGSKGAGIVQALANANSKDFKKIVSDWLVAQGVSRDLANDIAGIGTKAGGAKKPVDDLGGAINNLPKKHPIDITTPGMADAIRLAGVLKANLDKLHSVSLSVVTHYSSTGTPGTQGGIQWASGAVFPKLATGGQLMAGAGVPPFYAGDGTYPTFVGRGSEIVSNSGVFPLSDRVIDQLGDRVGLRARTWAGGDGGNHRPIVVQVMVDRREIARAVANSGVWDN